MEITIKSLLAIFAMYIVFVYIYKFYFKKVEIRYKASNNEWVYMKIKWVDIHQYTHNDSFELIDWNQL